MNYSYQPKHPKTKLHEIAIKYIASMRTLHFEANCSVAFGEGGPASPGSVRGWLLKDPRSADRQQRYLLLEDGDVWREVDAGAGTGERTWMAGPDDEVVTLLAQSLAKARMGVDPFLETEEHVQLQPHVVTDRRHEQHPYQGPERRKSS